MRNEPRGRAEQPLQLLTSPTRPGPGHAGFEGDVLLLGCPRPGIGAEHGGVSNNRRPGTGSTLHGLTPLGRALHRVRSQGFGLATPSDSPPQPPSHRRLQPRPTFARGLRLTRRAERTTLARARTLPVQQPAAPGLGTVPVPARPDCPADTLTDHQNLDQLRSVPHKRVGRCLGCGQMIGSLAPPRAHRVHAALQGRRAGGGVVLSGRPAPDRACP